MIDKKLIIALVAAVVAVAVAAAVLLSLPQTDDKRAEIEYELNGGANDPANPIFFNGVQVVLADPTYDGHFFGGWYTEAEFVNKVTALMPSEGVVKVYAKWIDSFEVWFEGNGGESPESLTITPGAHRELAPIEKIFNKFCGWFTDESFSSDIPVTSTDSLSGDTVLYAKWEPWTGHTFNYEVTGTIKRDNVVFNVNGIATISIFNEGNNGRYLHSERIVATSTPADGVPVDNPFDKFASYSSMLFVPGNYVGKTTATVGGETIQVSEFKNNYISSFFGSDGILYMLEHRITWSASAFDLHLQYISSETFTVSDTCTVSVSLDESSSATVTGAGTFQPGENVELSISDFGSSSLCWELADNPGYGLLFTNNSFDIMAVTEDVSFKVIEISPI